VDVVDRPRLDAVAVLVYRTGASGIEVLTRMNLRPAAYFRAEKPKAIPDDRGYLFVEEIVAGLLEPTDSGEEGVRQRAASEVREEAGYAVSAGEVAFLSAPFFAVPGILSEKIYLTCVDVTGKTQLSPCGDGSPMEEGGRIRWRPLQEIIHACRAGEIPDAKTEIAAVRFREGLGESGKGR
jgi:ADP-ribose pyrophosphatase